MAKPEALTLNRIFVVMRAWLGYMFILLISSLYTALPTLASPARTTQAVIATVSQTRSVEQLGRSQHCDQLEDTEAITATCSQPVTFGQVVPTIANKLDALMHLVTAAPLPGGRDNARIQPFYRLILFPFHVFW